MRVRIGERWELRRRDASNWELYHLRETADNKRTRESGTAGRVTWHGTGRYYQYNTDPATEYLQSEECVDEVAHSDWMRKCLNQLTELTVYTPVYADLKYGVLLSLPGWEQSEGARLERMIAEAIGMEVIEAEEIGL